MMSKDYSKVYVVINDGEVVYASTDSSESEDFALTGAINATALVLDEDGNDDPSEEEMAEAAFRAGFDGDYYEVECVDISGLGVDDVVETNSGAELDVSDILDALNEAEDEM